MDGKSLTPQEEKLKQLKEILPEAFAEGKVDWEKLKATLGEDINFANERYVLNWAGKSEAFKVLQTPVTKTLVPDKEESVNFDETNNIFIEGENLEVLKVLQKSYFGKVKMIYIDPPYNTGNDSFIYPDKFSETKAEYQKRIGDKNEEGYLTKDGMFRKNSKENGQYHSNWLNMMYPRLFLAKNLLKQDGVIFVSIDDNEVHNLRMIMNEVFGEENFVAAIIWKKTENIKMDSKYISENKDYILCYKKYGLNEFNKRASNIDRFKLEDDKGKYYLRKLDSKSSSYSKSLDYVIEHEGKKYYPSGSYEKWKRRIETGANKKDAIWLWSKKKFEEGLKNNEIVFKNGNVYNKVRFDGIAKKPYTDFINSPSGQTSQKVLNELFDNIRIFDHPKPIELIKELMSMAIDKDDFILDFFSGSGTTAHAVMQLNAESGGNRKCISVQLPELTDEKSEAYKAGYKTIADIAKDRIRRAGKKIQEEIKQKIKTKEKKIKELESQLDIDEKKENINKIKSEIENLKLQDLGFKVLKLSNSNFKQWQQITGNDAKALEEQMKLFVDPVSKNATIENMVYELLLKSGKDLNSKLEHKNNYYCVNDNELILMLEKATQEIVDAVLKENPQKIIALDKLFKDNDQLKTNTSLQMRDAGIEFKTI